MKDGAAAVLAVLAVLALGCREPAPRHPLRLGPLVELPAAPPVALPAGAVEDGELLKVGTDLSAARVTRLALRARGNATIAKLSWRLAGDPRFLPYRALSFPLVPDGREHDYDVDLGREPYWTGRVRALRLSPRGGGLDVLSFAGRPGAGLQRSMAIAGDSVPSLPGLARIEVALPAGLPREAELETRLGLVPEHDRPGVEAVFRVWRVDGGRRELWLEERLRGGGERGEHPGWLTVRKTVRPRGATRLALEVEAMRRGRRLPEGVALWGDPMLWLPGAAPGPNLVVVLIDTLRADALGAWGGRGGTTPRLDAFARESIRLADLSAPAPWTLPSVCSLLTGLEPQTHGAGRRHGTFAPTGLTAEARTLAETLRDAGLYTAGVYHNIYVNPAFGVHQGFDEYLSLEERSDKLVDAALERLERWGRERRFFLYLHLYDPHNPYEPPERECREVARRFDPGYRGQAGCVVDRRPENPVPPPADRQWGEALYHSEVAHVDAQVGRLLDGLRDSKLDGNTVVAVVSDHGEEFWARSERERALGYEPDIDHGHTHYQELLHVVGLIRAPGRPPAVVREPAGMTDLFPTLLRLVGVEPPPNQGRDLFADGPLPRPTLLSDFLLHGERRWSVRRGPWKLIVPETPGAAVELYDLRRDPGETTDLSPREPRLVADLRAWGERTRAQRTADRRRYVGDESVGATYLEWNHITKLRSLGYLR